MSHRAHTKSRIKVCNKSFFHLQDKKADSSVLSNGLIKSAKRSGQLSLCNRGLGTVPENVWKIDELVLEEYKDVDFTRSDDHSWWNSEPLKTLDLSSNAISTISTNIKLLQELVTLKLHDNAITELPKEIGELKNLANLSLDRNKLKILPKEFYKLTELRWLSISHNMLEKIEPDMGDLVMLTYLDLSHNSLTSLPPGLGYLVRLLQLDLSHNQLEELPPDIVNLRDLKKLLLAENKLTFLPAMGELRKMEYLDANHNNIAELPDFLGCTALKEIYIANNEIKKITEDFCDQMQHLNVLNIRDNKIEELPENISLLQTLKRLDMSNNNLTNISVTGNRLTSVRADIARGGRLMQHLRDQVQEDPTDVPQAQWPDKYTLKKTQALTLVSRDLTEIPDEVVAAAADAQVYYVDLTKNKLTSVPVGITRLSESLTQLILKNNNISTVPAELSRCSLLLYLDLGSNNLAELPLELGELKQLRELVISNNRFTHLPRCIYDLESLEILLAADNKVSEINVSSDALARLKRLAVLDLKNNSIVTVPPELGNFTHLRSLELMGNVFRQPRHAILEKGTESVLSYLRDRIPK
ncbi:hypothetical protein JYU34_009026 [Plutella xylostella]|uniref:Disease resistance R13L4/SHOC-2-like LRR domain-containing protein n=1 Tax=Plutella xylostella TaxID=51655 RepID=A0ABQ7QMI1_PLUXY|nr:hypothetical protein JYU34_009026 [Plutella xylostella]